MADNEPFRKYIDAGMVFTQLTRQRAEEIVRELLHSGELNREQAARWVEELLERSRQSTELLLAVIRKELDERIALLNLVTREDLANLAARVTGGRPAARPPAKAATKTTQGAATKKKAATRAAPAKKAATKATPTKKAATRAAPAKKAATTRNAATTKQAAPSPPPAKAPAARPMTPRNGSTGKA